MKLIVIFQNYIKYYHIMFINIVFFHPGDSVGIIGAGQLENSTTNGGGPSYNYEFMTFFFVPTLLYSILTPLFFPVSCVSLSCFILAVPMRLFRKTLLHEFLISYSHAKLYIIDRSFASCNAQRPLLQALILKWMLNPCNKIKQKRSTNTF